MLSCLFCEQKNAVTNQQCQTCGAPLPIDESTGLEASVFRTQLLQLITQGEKLQAISAYRRQFSCSLEDAKEAVDVLDRDQQFATARPIADVEREVGKLLERGEKLQAIKVYREQTGVGLKEAKEEVDAIETRLGLEPEDAPKPGGCFGVVLLFGCGSIWLTRTILSF